MFSCFKSGESAELRSLRSRITELESKLLDKEKNQVHVCLSRRPLWLSGSLSASFANIFAFLILILSRQVELSNVEMKRESVELRNLRSRITLWLTGLLSASFANRFVS